MSAMISRTGSADEKQKADALVATLVGMGLPARVEPRANLAVISVSADVLQRLGEPEVRRAVLAEARQLGFTHVAVELAAD